MNTTILDLIDFEKVDSLLEGFNKTTGFVTAILDLDGTILSKSGWRSICTEFHRINPETSKRCTISDTVLAGKLAEGENYHFYKCLNGLVDVAVPIVIKGEHIANLFSGQFLLENPDSTFFKDQAKKFGCNEEIYLKALKKVPVVSMEKVKTAMTFLLDMTYLISEMTFQKLEQLELNESLEQRVFERTAQLQAVNKELETFTYSVSHDLKAPLRGIDGYSKLLLDLYGTSLNDEAQTFLKTIRTSTTQMNQLIEDLLEYSQLERSQMRNDKIRISDLITSLVSSYTDELKENDFLLKTEIPDIELVANEKGLTIALRNLMDNAIKFTKGKINPYIEIEVVDQEFSWLIRVKDNGKGFDMKYHQRIFEIFQRLHRAEDIPGTGVGLAMVTKAMQRMHGKVWAESILDIGSTFYLEIPKIKIL